MSFLAEPITIVPLRPVRKIGSINVNVVLTENTNDTLTITRQPVQQGASITDHAYKEPTVISMTAYFKSNSLSNVITNVDPKSLIDSVSSSLNLLAKIYKDLLELQSSRVPFDVITPKRIYRNMLMAALSQTTDKATENCLKVDMTFQEIIIVKLSTTQVSRIAQKIAAVTGKTENAGKKSVLHTITAGIGSIFR